MGRRHDLQHWDADTERLPKPAGSAKLYAPNRTAGVKHDWVASVFEPVRERFFADYEVSWTFAGEPNEVFAVLQAIITVDGELGGDDDNDASVKSAFESGFDACDDLEAISDEGQHGCQPERLVQ